MKNVNFIFLSSLSFLGFLNLLDMKKVGKIYCFNLYLLNDIPFLKCYEKCYVQISNVITLSHREKIITFLSIPAAVGSDGLPIGQYFLYKLIAQQKDVGYKNLLRTDLVTQVRQETINRKSELYKKLHYKYRYNLLSLLLIFPLMLYYTGSTDNA